MLLTSLLSYRHFWIFCHMARWSLIRPIISGMIRINRSLAAFFPPCLRRFFTMWLPLLRPRRRGIPDVFVINVQGGVGYPVADVFVINSCSHYSDSCWARHVEINLLQIIFTRSKGWPPSWPLPALPCRMERAGHRAGRCRLCLAGWNFCHMAPRFDSWSIVGWTFLQLLGELSWMLLFSFVIWHRVLTLDLVSCWVCTFMCNSSIFKTHILLTTLGMS